MTGVMNKLDGLTFVISGTFNNSRNDLKNMLEASSSKKTLEKMGIIDHTLVNDWKEGLYSGKRDTSWQLWTLISYKQWLESKGKF